MGTLHSRYFWTGKVIVPSCKPVHYCIFSYMWWRWYNLREIKLKSTLADNTYHSRETWGLHVWIFFSFQRVAKNWCPQLYISNVMVWSDCRPTRASTPWVNTFAEVDAHLASNVLCSYEPVPRYWTYVQTMMSEPSMTNLRGLTIASLSFKNHQSVNELSFRQGKQTNAWHRELHLRSTKTLWTK